jgi:hypothetical protein
MLHFPMAKLTPQQQAEIQALFPSLVAWVEQMEAKALSEGTPLNDLLKNTAAVLGIKGIGSLRICAVNAIPEPDNPRIVQLASEFGLSFAESAGMTFHHAIFVCHSHSQDVRILTHELVHVRQYEQAGSVAHYLQKYVKQIIDFGYQNMPLEREAVSETDRLLGPPRTYLR